MHWFRRQREIESRLARAEANAEAMTNRIFALELALGLERKARGELVEGFGRLASATEQMVAMMMGPPVANGFAASACTEEESHGDGVASGCCGGGCGRQAR